MKKIKLFEQWLNEIKFNSVEDFKAYKANHKMRDTTEVTIGNKVMKAGEVGKAEPEKETEAPEFKGLTGHYKPADSLNSEGYYISYKKKLYSWSKSSGWNESWASASFREELETLKVPASKVLQAIGKQDPEAVDSILIELGLKKLEPKKAARQEAIDKQTTNFDETKKYKPIETDQATDQVVDKIKKDKDLKEFLGYLVHDKSHVFDNKKEVPEMSKVFDMTKDVEHDKPLYRGMYGAKASDFKVGQVLDFGRYQSFSEDPGVAKGFADPEEGKAVILKMAKSKGGFNYGAYMQSAMKSDRETANFARYEREHIMNRDQKYRVQKIEQDGPFTVVHVQQV